MKNQIQLMLSMMSKPELQELKDDVEELLRVQLIQERERFSKIETCPNCGSIHIKKNGTTAKIGQRYYCNDCHKSFSTATSSFTFHSRVSDEQWKKFIDYEIAKLPLREEAYFLDLSVDRKSVV